VTQQPVTDKEIYCAFMSKKDKFRAHALGESEMEKRLVILREKSFDELKILPDYEVDDLKAGKYEVNVTTYRRNLEDGRLQIVVQWYFHMRLGFGQIRADGFTITKNNVSQDMEEKALYEFM